MRVLLIVAAFWLSATPSAHAQAVAAQSGEHDTFSRIVFPLARGTTWNTVRTSNGQTVQFSDVSLRIDVSRVLDFLPSGRLQGIRSVPGRLELEYVCACEVEVFRFNDAYLVVDLAQTGDGAGVETPARDPSVAIVYAPNSVADVTRFQVNEGPAAPVEVAQEAVETKELQEALVDVFQAEFLTPRTGLSPSTEDVAREAAIDQSTFATALAGRLGLRPEEDKLACSAVPSVLDPTQWGSSDAILASVSQLRAESVSASLAPVQEAAEGLAAAYVSARFGAEARATIESFGLDLPYIEAASRIVDGDLPSSPSPFLGLMHCDGFAVLWAVLSSSTLDTMDDLNSEALIRTLAQIQPQARAFFLAQVLRRVQAGSPLYAELENLMGSREPDQTPLEIALNEMSAASEIAAKLHEIVARGATVSDADRALAESVLETTADAKDRAELLRVLGSSHLLAQDIAATKRLVIEYPETLQSQSDDLLTTAAQTLAPVGLGEFLIFARRSGLYDAGSEAAQMTLLRAAVDSDLLQTARRTLEDNRWSDQTGAQSLRLRIALGMGDVVAARNAFDRLGPDAQPELAEQVAWMTMQPELMEPEMRSAALSWLAGDSPAVIENDAESPRAQLATLVQTPPSQLPSAGGLLDAATARLEQSEALREAVNSLAIGTQ